MTAPAPLQDAREIAIEDGLLVDMSTGEILGFADRKHALEITDEETANQALERILNAEAEIEAIHNTPAVLAAKAILENADKLAKQKQRRVDWYRKCYESQLAEFARAELERKGAKSRTWKSIYGSVSLRTVPARLEALDEQKAIEWAKTNAPTAVKTTEKLLISEVPKGAEVYIEVFRLVPERDTVTIKTGVSG